MSRVNRIQTHSATFKEEEVEKKKKGERSQTTRTCIGRTGIEKRKRKDKRISNKEIKLRRTAPLLKKKKKKCVWVGREETTDHVCVQRQASLESVKEPAFKKYIRASFITCTHGCFTQGKGHLCVALMDTHFWQGCEKGAHGPKYMSVPIVAAELSVRLTWECPFNIQCFWTFKQLVILLHTYIFKWRSMQ